MAKTRTKVPSKSDSSPGRVKKRRVQKSVSPRTKKDVWQHGEMTDLPLDQLEPNPWNPNEMTAAEFDMLSENIDEVDFLDPLLVVPLTKKKGEKQIFRIIDGEHRYEKLRLSDAKTAPCVIADPERLPEIKQKFQTVRMNVIHGKLNKRKLRALVEDVMTSDGVDPQDLPYLFGFADETEFEAMMEAARDSLPDDMKPDFDKAKGEIRTVEDLSLVLNRLFSKYGDTVPHHFMILDFGGKQHLWVRLDRQMYKTMVVQARECMAHGVTFDSVLVRAVMLLDVKDFVEKHSDFLEKGDDEDALLGAMKVVGAEL